MRVVQCVLGFLALFVVTAAHAQPYPSKPVKLIVPFPPGGSTDLVARSITPTLGDFLGQQVVIEYKGGAAGSIGTAEVERATPDGYTLLIVWDTHGVNHHLYNVQYDFFKSFDPITQLVQAPGILVAHPSFPASNFKDFLAYLRPTRQGWRGHGGRRQLRQPRSRAAYAADDTQCDVRELQGRRPAHQRHPWRSRQRGLRHLRALGAARPLGKLKALAVLGKSAYRAISRSPGGERDSFPAWNRVPGSDCWVPPACRKRCWRRSTARPYAR